MTQTSLLVSALGAVLVALLLGAAAGFALGVLRARAGAGLGAGGDPGAGGSGEPAVLRESLDRLHDQMRDLEHSRVSWQSRLHQQVDDVRQTTDSLRRETASLATALRKPAVRGRWGELHLRRAVELAGLVARCDFEEQVRLHGPDGAEALDAGALRPDLVVRLAGGRSIVVDAKVPLEAYLDATTSSDEEEREAHLVRHARQLRTHVDALSAKSYWRSLPGSPDFVVLFVPAESFLAAALDTEPGLLEHAAARHVVLASPTTLIGLLRTVALGWSHAALTEQAQEVHRLGRELHARLGTWSGHLDQVGRSLNAAVGHYNSAAGSLDNRVLVSARRFQELGVTPDELVPPRTVGLRAVDRRGAAPEDPPDRTVAL